MSRKQTAPATQWTTARIRQSFIDFFEHHCHTRVHSASLIPAGDKSLLFTNSGMVPFKDVFLGTDKRPYTRAVTAQRCLRAGGKHNDLDNVGYTARHHTFFEMLGNFSFGDYFKEEAIRYAWQFLTRELALPPQRLWVTVYEEDHETEAIWKNVIGIDPHRFSRCGEKDNFWSMGDTGPCGPCSEIFYDHGETVAGGPPGSPEEDGDRYVEIWNLVFMQFERGADGSLTPLPQPSVDTGMGLERLSAVLQHVQSNYDTELFSRLIKAARELQPGAPVTDPSFKVIADHIRSCAFLVVDGVLPANEGRGYVLRRIIRRAVRHGYRLGIEDSFFYRMVAPLCDVMGGAYPELSAQREAVEKTLLSEEKRFRVTLASGMRLLEKALSALTTTTIPGEVAFQLYDTYGFPLDLTCDIARERGLGVDEEGFERCMQRQRARARRAAAFSDIAARELTLAVGSAFVGYADERITTRVATLLRNGDIVDTLEGGEQGEVVLEQTPFYAESGGQLGDRGTVATGAGTFIVTDTYKAGQYHLSSGTLTSGTLTVGQQVEAQIDTAFRRSCERCHSATHLLHAALREALGTHVTQKGSLVAPDRLRFDFSHHAPLSGVEIERVETLVCQHIAADHPIEEQILPLAAARAKGAMALFGEKYGDTVRVVSIGDWSVELCGGTHLRSTCRIGPFNIVAETGVAAGVRRIEARCGEYARRWVHTQLNALNVIAQGLQAVPENIEQAWKRQQQKVAAMEQRLHSVQSRLNAATATALAASAVTTSGIALVVKRLDGQAVGDLKSICERTSRHMGSGVVVLAATNAGKIDFVCAVTADLTGRIKAGDVVAAIAAATGGRGGGRPHLAMGGGKAVERLDTALSEVAKLLPS